MDLKSLESLGITGAEMQVYLALLKLGSSPLSKVVRETGFQKSTVYNSAARLQEKGLISNVIKGPTRYFEATEPEHLMEFVREKKNELEKCEDELGDIVSKIDKGASQSADAHVFAGQEGFKTMRRDVLKNSSGELLILGGVGKEYKIMPSFFKNWNKSRLLKGIKVRVLYKKSLERTKPEIKKSYIRDYDIRFLPEEFEGPVVINIYGDRVANYVWKAGSPTCFLMINEDNADAYRRYFNFLWKLAEKPSR